MMFLLTIEKSTSVDLRVIPVSYSSSSPQQILPFINQASSRLIKYTIMSKRDYYQVLELKKGCSPEEVRAAYKKMAKKWHPDKNRDNREVAQKKFKQISEAYQVLSDQSKRDNYDRFGFEGQNIGRGGGGHGANFSGAADFSGFAGFNADDIFKNFFADFGDEDDFDFFKGFADFGIGRKKGRDNKRFGHFDNFGGFEGFGGGFGMRGARDMGGFDDDDFFSGGFGRMQRGFGDGFDVMGGGMGGRSGGRGPSKKVSTTTKTVNGKKVKETVEEVRHQDGTWQVTRTVDDGVRKSVQRYLRDCEGGKIPLQ